MTVVLEAIALLCTGLFAGAAIYITVAEHPARLECGIAIGITEFRPSYRRAAVMQASLVMLGSLAAIGAWMTGGRLPLVVAGVLLGALIPFTLIVIRPINARLLDPALERDSLVAADALRRWGRLHAVRSLTAGVAFAVLVLHLAGIV